MKTKAKSLVPFLIRWGLTLLISFMILLPIYWIFISSITPANELFKSPIQYIPQHPTPGNYIRLFTQLKIGIKIRNTLIITLCSLVISTIICLMGAYAFSRYKGRLLALANAAVLSSAMIPAIITARPLYDFMKNLSLIDTFPGLIILYTSNLIPFTMLILRNFLGEIPPSLDEAAEVDGANMLQKLSYITLPLMRPAVATILIINFITCLNDLLTPLFFANRIEVLSVGITTIPKETSYSMPWDLISTMGWIILFPIILFVILFEKQIMDGIMAGGVKQ